MAKTLEQQCDEITELTRAMREDSVKLTAGNNSAGTRVRKSAQGIKVLCQQIRKDVTDIREAAKKKK